MSGRPIIRERARVFREALLNGEDPVEAMKPYAARLREMALNGELDSATTLGAIKEAADRIDGKVVQEMEVTKTNTNIDADLLKSMEDLLKLSARREEKVIEPEKAQIPVRNGSSES